MTRILVVSIPHRQETRQLSGEKWTQHAAKRGSAPCSSRLLMIMTVVEFRQVRVIMGEGEVPVHVSMRFLKDRDSIVHVVVMLFVLMAVVMFEFLMPVCMRVAPAEE
jgi:hypothetical protein